MLIYGECDVCGLDVIDRAEYTAQGELVHPDCKPTPKPEGPPLTRQQQAWFDAYKSDR